MTTPREVDEITVTDAALLIGLTRQSIHRWIKEGMLTPTQRVGGQGVILLDREHVLDVAHRRPGAPAPLMAQPIPSDTTDPVREAAEDAFLELFEAFHTGWAGEPHDGLTGAAEAVWVAGRRAAARA